MDVVNRIKEGKIKESAAMCGYSILISGLRALRREIYRSGSAAMV
jgi:hypothetical protein